MRDTQRAKLYRAERAAWGCCDSEPQMTLEQCKALVKKAARFAHGPVPEIRDGRGARWARVWAYWLTLPKWARTRWVVLHEYAHALDNPFINDGHGRRFARNYLRLVRRFIGKTEAEVLRLAYKENHVHWRGHKNA